VTLDELMARLSGLRRAQIGEKRAPHKPLLLLWLFGLFAATGSARATYAEAASPIHSPLYLPVPPLLHVRPGQPSVDVMYISWHTIQVFKSHGHLAA